MSKDHTAEHARAWSTPGVVSYFDCRRDRSAEVYESEWLFLRERLSEGISVLDVGCAQGGFAGILGEHLSRFRYTGIDISRDMIARACGRFPDHTFHHVSETDWSALGTEHFDLVLVLGILHLHEAWRDTVAAAWARTQGALILDLRETSGQGIEDIARSSFRMNFNDGSDDGAADRLPYNVINSAQAMAAIETLSLGHRRIRQYGYTQPPSTAAETPFATVIAKAYCIER